MLLKKLSIFSNLGSSINPLNSVTSCSYFKRFIFFEFAAASYKKHELNNALQDLWLEHCCDSCCHFALSTNFLCIINMLNRIHLTLLHFSDCSLSALDCIGSKAQAVMEEMMDGILSIQNLSIQVRRSIIEDVSFLISMKVLRSCCQAQMVWAKAQLRNRYFNWTQKEKRLKEKSLRARFGDVLSLNGEELQKYRSSIAYIQQNDEFSEMGNIRFGTS